MNDRLVWLVKNSRIYKWIRNSILRLSDSYSFTVSPVLLLLSQHAKGIFNRYDVVVRYMAIEDIEGTKNGGLGFYHKMQKARNEYLISAKTRIRKEDLNQNKQGVLTKLVESFRKEGYRSDIPISVNANLKLIDGSHRLACALYFKTKSVMVYKSGTIEIDYGLYWFKRYFDSNEVLTIQNIFAIILSQIDIKAVLTEILLREKQVFGRGEFYQSCEEIGIPGQRPTVERYKIYGLDKHLTGDLSVLDIGCNCGFFTLLIASKVKSAVGVEISQTLVDIAQVTQVYLGRENVHFLQGNFNSIKLDHKFDFICSFAVHHWLGADMRKYGKRLHNLLNPQGKVLLESQNINDQDLDWEEKLAKFRQAGFKEVQSGELKDDGVIERCFSVLQKV